MKKISSSAVLMLLVVLLVVPAYSAVYYINHEAGEDGDGSEDQPFATIGSILPTVSPGDTILVYPGTYHEQINPVYSGTAESPVVLKAIDPNDRPLIIKDAEEGYYPVDISRRHYVLDGFVIDAGWGSRRPVRLREGADSVIIRNCEIRNSTSDGVLIVRSHGVLFEGCEIHHLLAGTFTDQADAHGISGQEMRNLTIRNCDIHHVSGDCFQADPGRGTSPRWGNVLIENTTLWTGPLEEDAAGWLAGESPGENAIDTKVEQTNWENVNRPLITLRNVEAWGWDKNGYIGNRAAFNIKEKVECVLENVKVHDCEIAYRLRGSLGGALVTIINSVIYNCDKAIRAEDGLENLHVYNTTFGLDIGTLMQTTSALGDGFEMKNCLMIGGFISHADSLSCKTAAEDWFVDTAANDYRILASSPANGTGQVLAEVSADIEGNPRDALTPDLGAYENIEPPRECDINGDGKSNIADVIALMLKGRADAADPLADWNADGSYTVTDAIALLIDITQGNCP